MKSRTNKSGNKIDKKQLLIFTGCLILFIYQCCVTIYCNIIVVLDFAIILQ